MEPGSRRCLSLPRGGSLFALDASNRLLPVTNFDDRDRRSDIHPEDVIHMGGPPEGRERFEPPKDVEQVEED